MSREAPRAVVCRYCRAPVVHNNDHRERCESPCPGTFQHPPPVAIDVGPHVDLVCLLGGQYNLTHDDIATVST